MSRCAHGYDQLLELGAGTGAITERLVRDHGAHRMVVFELDSQLAAQLQAKYPAAKVYDGCLHERSQVFQEAKPNSVAVSSLPFRSLPPSVLQATTDVIEDFLLAYPGRRLVQFTYGMRVPFEPQRRELAWHREQRVWANLPPAAVWTLRAKSPK
jgi:phosphatidylethanolamine/phosphatidyl-N-methylethanolamine N-methyltransferase